MRRKMVAKLPYTYTICPPNDAPKLFTVASPQMLLMVKQSLHGDLTIDQRQHGLWQSWEGRPMGANIEDLMEAAIKGRTK
jgi:hypothetical protein